MSDSGHSELQRPTTTYLETGVVVVTVVGEVDLYTGAPLRVVLTQALADPPVALTGAVLDLAGVTFLDSSGLNVLAAAQKDALSKGLTWRLGGPQAVARGLLDLTGLTRHFEIYPDRTAAVNATT